MRKIPKILFFLLHAGLFVYLNFFMLNARRMLVPNVVYTLLFGPVIFAPLLYPAVYGRARDYLQVILFPVAGAAPLLAASLLFGAEQDLGPFCMGLFLSPAIALLGLNVTAFCCRKPDPLSRLGIPAFVILWTVIFGFMVLGRAFEKVFIVYMGILVLVSAVLSWVMSFRILTASAPAPTLSGEKKPDTESQ